MSKICGICQDEAEVDATTGMCDWCTKREKEHDEEYAAYLDAQAKADDVAFERASWPEPCECVQDMPGHHRCCPHHVSRR
jgi:hypothetical protein